MSKNDIDILTITETWLQMCPTGHQFHHVTRKNTRGGIGLLLKKHIKVKKQSQKEFSSFEYLDDILNNYKNDCHLQTTAIKNQQSKHFNVF